MPFELETIFRDYSVRGVVPDELDADVADRVGRAFGTWVLARGPSNIVVGRDGRRSSPLLHDSAIAGILAAGANVTGLGLVPTPVWNFAASGLKPCGGLMVTASHNPPAFNGFKFRLADPVVEQEMAEIKEIAANGEFASGRGTFAQMDILPRYRQAIEPYLRRAAGHRTIAVDCGNGATSELVPGLLRETGNTIMELNCAIDGDFPGRGPDPSAGGALDRLAGEVVASKADLGLAFDGDGDRLIVVDDTGHVLLGDELLMVLARHLLMTNPGGKVVFDASATRALSQVIKRAGGVAIRSRVGYPFVYDAVRQEKALLGGELSGHMFFGDDPGFRYDDATVAALRLLSALNDTGKSLSSMLAGVPRYYKRPAEKINADAVTIRAIMSRLPALLREDGQIDQLDGVSVEMERGWALVRPSQTEPIIRVSIEAESREDYDRIRERVISRIDQARN